MKQRGNEIGLEFCAVLALMASDARLHSIVGTPGRESFLLPHFDTWHPFWQREFSRLWETDATALGLVKSC